MVTGASRGIGAEVARKLAARGADVVAVSRDARALDELCREIGGESRSVDLSRSDELLGAIADIQRDGPVDLLVNNAGIDLPGRFADAEPAELERLVSVDLLAPMLLTNALVPGWIERGRGHVVNVSSLAAAMPWPGLVAYCGAKAGLSQFSEALRLELRATPIGITLVELGAVDTELLAGNRAHGPTGRSWERAERLGLSVEIDAATAADAIVDAVAANRAHVRLPRRTGLAPAIVGIPRAVARGMLVGVDFDSD